MKLLKLIKQEDGYYLLESILAEEEVQALLEIGANTALKVGVLYIDGGGEEEEEDPQQELLFIHDEPETKQ